MVLPLLLLVGACANPRPSAGRPDCFTSPDEVGTALILQFQAVPHARWGPCIETLRSDWEFGGQSFRNGRAGFWLNSAMLGDRFLKVELEAACSDPEGESEPPPAPAVVRHSLVYEEPLELPVIVVPEHAQQNRFADAVAFAMNRRIVAGHTVAATVDFQGIAEERIARGLEQGAAVIVVDALGTAENVVQLHLEGRPVRRGLSIEQALHAMGDVLPEAVYRADWVDIFQGGCIEYHFDATGEDSATVVDDAFAILGFNDYAVLRAAADAAGYGY